MEKESVILSLFTEEFSEAMFEFVFPNSEDDSNLPHLIIEDNLLKAGGWHKAGT